MFGLGVWELFIIVILLPAAGALAEAPVLVALRRRHPRLKTIAWVNALWGWTLIGWIYTLTWSLLPIRESLE